LYIFSYKDSLYQKEETRGDPEEALLYSSYLYHGSNIEKY